MCAWQHLGGFSTASVRDARPLCTARASKTHQHHYEMIIELISFSRLICYNFTKAGQQWCELGGWHHMHALECYTCKQLSHKLLLQDEKWEQHSLPLMSRLDHRVSKLFFQLQKGLQSLQSAGCRFLLFLSCLFHNDDVKDQSLWILINLSHLLLGKNEGLILCPRSLAHTRDFGPNDFLL